MNPAVSSASQGILSLEEQVARLQALLEATRQVHSSISVQHVLTETARILVRELEVQAAVFKRPGTDEIMAGYGTRAMPDTDKTREYSLFAKDGSLLASLFLVPRDTADISLYDEDFIEGLTLQASVALENAVLHERDLEWARVQHDLEAARKLQRSLLPPAMPVIPGISLAARSLTCYEVGGDYLDAIRMPDGSHLFVVADVAGKGLTSAIAATSIRAAFRALLTEPVPLEHVVARVGEQHWREGAESQRRYMTAVFARLSPAADTLEVVNAGHNPALLILPDGHTRMIEASGTPLGLLPGMTYRNERFPFPAGSRLLLYTDGLTEVFCGEEEFGCERLTEAFRTGSTEDADEVLDAIWSQLRAYGGSQAQTDDMTALALFHRAPLPNAEQVPNA